MGAEQSGNLNQILAPSNPQQTETNLVTAQNLMGQFVNMGGQRVSQTFDPNDITCEKCRSFFNDLTKDDQMIVCMKIRVMNSRSAEMTIPEFHFCHIMFENGGSVSEAYSRQNSFFGLAMRMSPDSLPESPLPLVETVEPNSDDLDEELRKALEQD